MTIPYIHLLLFRSHSNASWPSHAGLSLIPLCIYYYVIYSYILCYIYIYNIPYIMYMHNIIYMKTENICTPIHIIYFFYERKYCFPHYAFFHFYFSCHHQMKDCRIYLFIYCKRFRWCGASPSLLYYFTSLFENFVWCTFIIVTPLHSSQMQFLSSNHLCALSLFNS